VAWLLRVQQKTAEQGWTGAMGVSVHERDWSWSGAACAGFVLNHGQEASTGLES